MTSGFIAALPLLAGVGTVLAQTVTNPSANLTETRLSLDEVIGLVLATVAVMLWASAKEAKLNKKLDELTVLVRTRPCFWKNKEEDTKCVLEESSE